MPPSTGPRAAEAPRFSLEAPGTALGPQLEERGSALAAQDLHLSFPIWAIGTASGVCASQSGEAEVRPEPWAGSGPGGGLWVRAGLWGAAGARRATCPGRSLRPRAAPAAIAQRRRGRVALWNRSTRRSWSEHLHSGQNENIVTARHAPSGFVPGLWKRYCTSRREISVQHQQRPPRSRMEQAA